MRAHRSAPRPDIRSVLRANHAKIDELLAQWSASGRLPAGSLAPRPDPHARPQALTRPPPGGVPVQAFPELDKAVRRAKMEHDAAAAALRGAEGKRLDAQAAVDLAAEEMAAKKKKKKGEPTPEELQAVLDACVDASERLRPAAEQAKAALDAAEAEVGKARAKAEVAAKLQQMVAMESRLRSLHLKATGRHLPCRLPNLLEQARAQVKAEPEQLMLGCDDMKRALLALAVAKEKDMGGLRGLFRRAEEAELRVHEQRVAEVEAHRARRQLEQEEGLGLRPQIAWGANDGGGGQAAADVASPRTPRRPPPGVVSYATLIRHCNMRADVTPAATPVATPRQRPASAHVLGRGEPPAGAPEHRSAPQRPQSGHVSGRRQ